MVFSLSVGDIILDVFNKNDIMKKTLKYVLNGY